MNSEFNSGNAGGFSNFMKTPSLKSIQKQMKVQRKGISLPKLSTLVSVRDHETIMSKHRLRQEAMEVCLPECAVSDKPCNCRKLFDCVTKLDEYDMAVLTARGFIDVTAGSENYGEFSVGADKLNLYDLEDIGKRLQAVKHTVQSGNSNDSSNCNAVLNNFHSACDPSSESCSSANQQSFQGRALLLAS
eukprot:scaffold18706_cov41-Cyclotella_meneghiniana.AAC.1